MLPNFKYLRLKTELLTFAGRRHQRVLDLIQHTVVTDIKDVLLVRGDGEQFCMRDAVSDSHGNDLNTTVL